MVRLHSYGTDVSFYHFDQCARKITLEKNINNIDDIVDFLNRIVGEECPDRNIYLARGFLIWLSLAHKSKSFFQFKRYEEFLVYSVSFFEAFCRSANIECEIIRGKAKAKQYKVGESVAETHHWLAFKEKDIWHLIDPGWCLMDIEGHSHGGEILLERDGKNALQELTPQEGRKIQLFDDFTFCTNPDVFLYSHFPDDPEWQLRQDPKPPITLDAWFNLPFLDQTFFKLNLVLLSEESCRLTANNNGRCTIQISAEGTTAKHLKCAHYLYFSTEDAPADLNENALPMLVLQGRDANEISFELRLPVKGKYRFVLYFGRASERLNICCEFSIRCHTTDANCRRLQINPANGFGYSREAEEAGLLKPSVSGPKIFAKSLNINGGEDMMPKVLFRVDKDQLEKTEYGAFYFSGGKTIYYKPELDQVRRILDVTPNILNDEFEFAIMVATRPRNTLDPFAPLLYYIVTREDDTKQERKVEDAKSRERELRRKEKKHMKLNENDRLKKQKYELTASINIFMTEESNDVGKTSEFLAHMVTELHTESTVETLYERTRPTFIIENIGSINLSQNDT